MKIHISNTIIWSSLTVAMTTAVMDISKEDQRGLWPDVVVADHVPFRRSSEQGMTNQERMKRGSGPAKPKRLYMNNRAGIAKRITSQPSKAVGGGGTWYFDACYPAIGSGGTNSDLTNPDANSAAQACAQITAGWSDRSHFALGPANPKDKTSTFVCYFGYTEPSESTSESCTAADFAQYKI